MKALRKIKKVASALITTASVGVLICMLGAVHINEVKFAPIAVCFASIAWLWYVSEKQSRKGGEADGLDG